MDGLTHISGFGVTGAWGKKWSATTTIDGQISKCTPNTTNGTCNTGNSSLASHFPSNSTL